MFKPNQPTSHETCSERYTGMNPFFTIKPMKTIKMSKNYKYQNLSSGRTFCVTSGYNLSSQQ